MAKQINVALVDDLDGSPAADTISFSINGQKYTLDLSESNAARFHAATRPFIDAAKRSARQRKAIRATQPGLATEQQKAIRDWCNANGIPVAARGRIPREALEAFAKGHPIAA